mmetsp:Transcript_47466/g.88921  ORF Transcript_47466/g.88921 Transcript_47466/m.88921 type:complete len:1023 (-) Transcript_47466:174-3242(-)
MSKWVAKKDDAGVNGAVQRAAERPVGGGVFNNGSAGGGGVPNMANATGKSRDEAERRREAGEARRRIRQQAQEARNATGGESARPGRKSGGGAADDLGPMSINGAVGGGPGPGASAAMVAGLAPSVEALLNTAAAMDGDSRKGRKADVKGKGDADKKKLPAKGGTYPEWEDGKYWTDWTGAPAEWKQDEWQTDEWQPKDWGYLTHAQEWMGNEDDWGQNDWTWDATGACWGEDQSEWDEYIQIKDGTVRVDLKGAELGDADLKALVRHLDNFMQSYVEKTHGVYSLNIDLSCNSYISDQGVEQHLVSFLNRWPVCHRLKLYNNTIGDHALKALTSWISDGYVHELHLSDLLGKVTQDSVWYLLKEIHRKGNYPYVNGSRSKCALWLRLEHNGIQNVDDLIAKGKAAGMSLCVLDKNDLARVRPGASNKGVAQKDIAAVNLVLFRMQDRSSRRGRMAIPEELGSARGDPSESLGKAGMTAVGAGPGPVGGKVTNHKGGRGAAEYYRGGTIGDRQLWEIEDAEGLLMDDDSYYDQTKHGTMAKPGTVAELQKLWEQSGPQAPHQGAKPRGAQSKQEKFNIADLQMGCASYRPTQRSSPAGAPMSSFSSKVQKPSAKSIDFSSSAAFPSLGGSADAGGGDAGLSGAGGIWGTPNIHAAVAWGSAPSAVFDGKARELPKPKAAEGPPPKASGPPPGASMPWTAGFPPVGGNPSWPAAGDSGLPVGGLPSWGASPPGPRPAPAPASPEPADIAAEAAEEEMLVEEAIAEPLAQAQAAEDVEWRPLSFAEKNLLKVQKKLREIIKIEELIASGEVKVESNQIAKVRKKAQLEQELRTLEHRSRAQGGRTLQELEKAEKMRRETEERERAVIIIQKVFRGYMVRRPEKTEADRAARKQVARSKDDFVQDEEEDEEDAAGEDGEGEFFDDEEDEAQYEGLEDEFEDERQLAEEEEAKRLAEQQRLEEQRRLLAERHRLAAEQRRLLEEGRRKKIEQFQDSQQATSSYDDLQLGISSREATGLAESGTSSG